MSDNFILVTGGGGFIGSHTVLVLLERGYNVVVLDNGSNSHSNEDKPESLIRVEKLTGKRVEFVKCDLLSPGDLCRIFTEFKISCVVHCAALKSMAQSMKDPLSYYRVNVSGAITLLDVMSKSGVKTLVFSSSAMIYGKPQFLPLTEKHPIGQNCSNPYAKSKYFFEEILKNLATSDKEWRVYCLRFFNPAGAHPSGELGEDPLGIPNNLMPIVVQVAIGKMKSVQICGGDYDTIDGTGVRDYIHVMDLANGHVAAVDKLLKESNEGCIFKEYNLGTGVGSSVLQVIKTFETVNNVSVPHHFVERRSGDVASIYCSDELAQKELNWKPKYGLADMCRDVWNWQSKNRNGYRK